MTWKAIDRYSKDYIELQTKDNVKFYKTPDSILQKQLEIFDSVMDKRKDNALFVEIIDSQKKWAQKVYPWTEKINIPTPDPVSYNWFIKK